MYILASSKYVIYPVAENSVSLLKKIGENSGWHFRAKLGSASFFCFLC